MPASIKTSIANGAPVQRQGDWYFVPVAKPSAAAKETGFSSLDGDHMPAECFATGSTFATVDRKSIRVPDGTIYVRGTISHAQHDSIYLDGWHKAIRNKAIRIGRLGRINND